MTVRKESYGDTLACDGCGRSDAGPGQFLDIQPYAVHDPNVGSGVLHHYCPGCAANRGLADQVATIPGWTAAPLVTTDVASSDRRSQRR
jgi:hypothetical protein